MLGFRSVTVQDRSFPSYDDCPGVYYRFGGKGDYGPQKLDRVVSFFAARSDEMIEGRFADENQWRPFSYFLELWNRILPSAHTIRRLKRAGINPEGITECVGRKLLRDRQNSKPPTPRQIEYLRNAGIQVEEGLDRRQASGHIRERERALSEEQKRLAEAPEIEAYNQRLEELRSRVHELSPGWTPSRFDDAVSYMCYIAVVEAALDHATGADLVSFQSGLFSDGVTEADYYLDFTRDPSPAEIRAFQSELFNAYLLAESEEFDHLAILKRTLPMIKVSIV